MSIIFPRQHDKAVPANAGDTYSLLVKAQRNQTTNLLLLTHIKRRRLVGGRYRIGRRSGRCWCRGRGHGRPVGWGIFGIVATLRGRDFLCSAVSCLRQSRPTAPYNLRASKYRTYMLRQKRHLVGRSPIGKPEHVLLEVNAALSSQGTDKNSCQTSRQWQMPRLVMPFNNASTTPSQRSVPDAA